MKDTIRRALSVATSENLCIAQFNIKIAFLFRELDEDIYMRQQEGYSD